MKSTFKKTIFVITTLLMFITPQASLSCNSGNTVLVFDIHDVLMQHDIGKMVGKFFKNPSLIFKIGDLSNGSYGNNCKLRKIINSQTPICGTWKLISQLKRAGYPLYIFSNIDKIAFDELSTQFPAYFSLFEGHHVVHNNNALQKKPAVSAYDSCRELIEQRHPGKRIVFVDDREDNIKAACDAGFEGIHFTSVDQLKIKLKPLLK